MEVTSTVAVMGAVIPGARSAPGVPPAWRGRTVRPVQPEG